MKIFLPFKVKDIGGTSTFARKFKESVEKTGHQVAFEYAPDYDALFLIVQCPLKYVIDAKKRGKKIVQRLDGTYYWSVAGWKFPLMNAKAAYIRHFFTDFTIYQSKYSQACANRFLGKKRNDRHAIIYNGVDLDVFSDLGQKMNLRDNATQKVFFTASVFRRNDQITPIIEGLQQYRKKYDPNVMLYIAGNFVGEVKLLPETLKKLKFVTLLGKLGNSDLPSYERAADMFLFTHLNPPCPNNVIESLACGLPICGVADGAMPEIIQNSENGLLIPSPGTGFWRKRHFDASKFADNLFRIMQNQKQYRQKSRAIAEKRFSLNKMTNKYLEILGNLK
jgi:glycosyltransferase involved in cell wall biosynthesis